MKFKRVYHAFPSQGLKELIPQESTHEKKWVYATKDLVMSAVFLGRLGGDFTCLVGRDPETRKPYVCERFKGAFDLRYKGIKGSIYVLPGESFLERKTQWSEEVVSEKKLNR